MSNVHYILCLLCCLSPIAQSLVCYDYMRSSAISNMPRTNFSCPATSRFCFKSYIEGRENSGLVGWVESRGCASNRMCDRDGCVGTSRDQMCCCSKDLCNSVARSFWVFAVTFSIVTLFL